VVEAAPEGGDTGAAVHAARPAAWKVAAVGGELTSAAVMAADAAVVVVTEKDTTTDETSRCRPAAVDVSATPATMISGYQQGIRSVCAP
jgi:hypothetical protein